MRNCYQLAELYDLMKFPPLTPVFGTVLSELLVCLDSTVCSGDH